MYLNCLQAHYRQGVALQCLGRHAEALAAFSAALAQDEKSPQLLNTLYDAAMKSPLKGMCISLFSEHGRGWHGFMSDERGVTVLCACRNVCFLLVYLFSFLFASCLFAFLFYC